MERIKQLHRICHREGVPTIAFTPPTAVMGPCRLLQKRLAVLIKEWAQTESMILGHFNVEELVPRTYPGHFWDNDEIHMSFDGQTRLGKTLGQILPLLCSYRQRLKTESSPHESSAVLTPPTPSLGERFKQVPSPVIHSGRALIGGQRPSVACSSAFQQVLAARPHQLSVARALPLSVR